MIVPEISNNWDTFRANVFSERIERGQRRLVCELTYLPGLPPKRKGLRMKEYVSFQHSQL